MSGEEYRVSCEGLQGKSCSVITGTVARWSDDGKMASGLKQFVLTCKKELESLARENEELKKKIVTEAAVAKREGTLNGIGIGVLMSTILFGGIATGYLAYKKRQEQKLVEKLEADSDVWNNKLVHHRERLVEHQKEYGVQWDDCDETVCE